jgi:D-xylose transport system ATP-binding protein
MAETVLEVAGLSKQYGATFALRDVSLELREGEILALLGDNGAGKSTLIKILSGVVAHDDGEIRLAGEAVRIESPKHAHALGIETVFQDLALFDNTNAVGSTRAGSARARRGWARSAGSTTGRCAGRRTSCSSACR